MANANPEEPSPPENPSHIEVGKSFPMRIPAGQEGIYPIIFPSGLVAAIYLNKFLGNEVNDVRSGKVFAGVSNVEDIAFLCLDFPFGVFDCYINPFAYEEDEALKWIQDRESNILVLPLVYGKNRIVRALRAVGLRAKLMNHLRATALRSLGRYEDGLDLNRSLLRIYSEMGPQEILGAAQHTTYFGDT